MQLYSTENADFRHDKAKYWADLYRQLRYPVNLRPLGDTAFAADLKLVSLGRLEIGEFAVTPSHVLRSARDVQETENHSFFLHFEISGGTRLSHCGHTITLQPGDLVLCDSHEPSEIITQSAHRNISLRMARELLDSYIPFPERLCGLRLDGGTGVVRLMREMLPNVWAQAREGIPGDAHESLADSLLALLGACYAADRPAAIDSAATRHLRARQIKQYIERRLEDPALSLDTIATAHGVSKRYLHRLFRQEGETISQYTLRRRLDECAARLVNPLWSGMTVTQIALSFGFSNSSHFSRAFRDRFGKTPSQYRATA